MMTKGLTDELDQEQEKEELRQRIGEAIARYDDDCQHEETRGIQGAILSAVEAVMLYCQLLDIKQDELHDAIGVTPDIIIPARPKVVLQ